MSAKAKPAGMFGKRNRRIVVGVIVISVVVHLLGGIGAAIWIVARYFDKPEAVFESRPVVTLQPKIIDPKLAAAEFEAAASKPTLDATIASVRETEFALPDIPQTPVDQKVEFDPSALVDSQIDAAASGFGSGAGGGGGGAGFSFFGITSAGTRIAFLIDISGSMVVPEDGIRSYQAVEAEVQKALDQLQPPATFNLLTFGAEGARYHSRMQEARGAEIERAMSWLKRQSPVPVRERAVNAGRWTGTDNFLGTKHYGTEIHEALALAFALKPDVMVVLSDGAPTFMAGNKLPKLKNGTRVDSPQTLLAWVREQQAASSSPVQIHTIAYKSNEAVYFMKALAEQNGGTSRMIE